MIWLEAAAAALVGIALLMMVLGPLISPEREVNPVLEPEELEETPKGVALLALREIEFDRVTGKLADEDYDMLKRKYTAQALAALRVEEGTCDARAGAHEHAARRGRRRDHCGPGAKHCAG